jgi:hypothetical protein
MDTAPILNIAVEYSVVLIQAETLVSDKTVYMSIPAACSAGWLCCDVREERENRETKTSQPCGGQAKWLARHRGNKGGTESSFDVVTLSRASTLDRFDVIGKQR